jgi:hypothetical protein
MRRSGILLAAILLAAAPANGQVRFAIEVFGGTAISFNTPLTIEQTGAEIIELTGDYETRPLDQPFYWAVRVGVRSPKSAWELQLIHHKMYLAKLSTEVQWFEVTHGFNILTVNYARETRPLTLRAGAGVVLPHVTGTVRGEDFSTSGGYEIGGPAFLVGPGKRWPIVAGLAVTAESQLTVGWIDISATGGRVSASNVAMHLWAGLGYTF